jgi:nucleotidyltransferase/DNA polymerase involved in DNA repair
MLALVRDLSTAVEYYSIDEFFFDATPPRGKTPQEYAELIRDRAMEVVRVPVTVGIARSRTLAKLISDTAKPFGARAVLDRDAEEALLASLPVTEVTGIAGRRERRLSPWGIRSCLDLANADRRLVRGLLTATGEALWWELRGEAVLPLHPDRPLPKVLSRGGNFGEPTDRPTVLWAWVVRNLERLIEELDFHEVRAGRLAVLLGYRDGRAGEGRTRLASPSDRFDVLLDALRPCVRRAWIPRAAAQRMHIFAEALTPRTSYQLGLFERPCARAEAIAALKREVNRRVGRFALRSGATLPLSYIYRDPANEYDVCDVRGKMCF